MTAAADPVVRAAHADARRTARTAGVAVRELTRLEDQAAAVRLLSCLWGRGLENPAVPPELLRALGKAGGYIAGALAPEGIVGASIGFHASPEQRALHSHISGVADSYAGRSVGHAMKLHQRAWALARGIDVVEWTFDPLVARNAHFNLVKLGARPTEYLVDFYGTMADAINGDDASDRLLLRWDLRSTEVSAAASGRPHGNAAQTAASGLVRTPVAASPAARASAAHPLPPGHVAVAVPADVERLRHSDRAAARRWREDVREQLCGLLARGGEVVGFAREVGYIVSTGEENVR